MTINVIIEEMIILFQPSKKGTKHIFLKSPKNHMYNVVQEQCPTGKGDVLDSQKNRCPLEVI